MGAVGMDATRISSIDRLPRQGRRFVLFGVLIVLVGLIASLYIGRFLTIKRLQTQLSDLVEQEQVALAVQTDLRARLALRDDPQAIEEVARAKIGLVKPGEEKVIFLIEGD
jgi:cell division protein FtsB